MPAFIIQLQLSLGRVLILLFCVSVTFSFSGELFAETETSLASIRVAIDDNYPKVEIIAQNWDAAQQTMKSGEADVIDTIFRTPQRELILDFSKPYVAIPITIYAHKDHTGITNISGLRGFRVGVKAGDACIDRLNEGGITDLQAYPSYELLLQGAIADQVHVFCMDEPPADYLIFRAQASQLFRKLFSIS